MIEENVKRAVEFLKNIDIRLLRRDMYLSTATNVEQAIALLSPPALSREHRIARELDDIVRMLDTGAIKVSVRNIADILRGKEPK